MEEAPKNLYVVVPAGGSGTRLWPKSREDNPKQFIKVLDGKSILQKTFERLEGFIPYERIFVIAQDGYKKQVFDQLPNLLPGNFITEPEKKGTSAAAGLAALLIKKIDPTGVMHFLVADDNIEDIPRFRRTIFFAAELAFGQKAILVYGVKPTFASTGLGYIQVGKEIQKKDEISVYETEKFIEKPEKEVAEKLINEGKSFWHGSGFTAGIDVLLGEMEKNWPNGFTVLKQIEGLSGLPADVEEGKIAELYKQIENIPIDISILEKAPKILMATLEDSWKDIGNWKTVYEILPKDSDGNVIIKDEEGGELISLDSKNNLINLNGKMVVTVGVEDLVVVDCKDVVMICKKDNSEDVKKIVNILKEKGKKELL